MNILWITNIILPPIAKSLNFNVPVTGGWMYSSALELIKDERINLCVATVYNGNKLIDGTINNIKYFLIPLKGKSNTKYLKELEEYWKTIYIDFKPDLTHIHGSEFAHGLAYINSCGNKNVVVSIQGLVSVHYRYYLAGISIKNILKNTTFKDIFKGNILSEQKKYYIRGMIEQEIIRKVSNVIGRTSWDKAHTFAINPNVNYFFCNETLRNVFYNNIWDYQKCEKHSIFISQAGYPIKGLHCVILALPLVLRNYPDTKIYIGGNNIIKEDTIKDKLKYSGYAKYLNKIIAKSGIKDRVIFTGSLDEEKMCSRYLKTNVFICPSSIENSPNSLGEAQLLGVPCIASYVGGSPEMMKGNEDYLYRFEEIEMLAMLIQKVFREVKKPNLEMRKIALSRHNPDLNNKQLINIYETIISGSCIDFNVK